MNMKLPLPQDKKLTVIFRIEPGCLGPEGVDHIDEFCVFAQKHIETVDADFVHWQLMPRLDKTQTEMQYKINNKGLDHDKAEKYLKLFNKELDEFEGHLHEKLSELIDQYLGH